MMYCWFMFLLFQINLFLLCSSPNSINVVVGEHDLFAEDGQETINVVDIIWHEDYK